MHDEDIIAYARFLKVPEAGLEYLSKAFEEPSRLVGTQDFRSVCVRFASGKMLRVIQAESHTCELPFVHAQELDEDVLAFLDQPPPLHFVAVDKRGRRYRARSTPDFLVVRKDAVILYECKPRSVLRALVDQNPLRWVCSDGVYRQLPAEQSAASLGLRYRVHDDGLINRIEAENLRILVDTKRSGIASLEPKRLERAIRLTIRRNGMTLRDLADEMQMASLTPLFVAILEKRLHVLLRWQLLTTPDSTIIFGSTTQMDQAEAALAKAAQLDPLRAESFSTTLLLTPKQRSEALRRLERVRRIQAGELAPNRSDYRYLARFREAEAAGDGVIAHMAPAFHLRGRGRCVPDRALELMEEVVGVYKDAKQWTITSTHRLLRAVMTDDGMQPVCYETLRKYIKQRSKAELEGSRGGKRVAKASMPPVPIPDRAIRVAYAWGVAHVDSTPLDDKIWLPLGLSETFLAKPTLYLLVDDYTDYYFAYWLCFDSAGDQAVACLLRDCVRRHGRLPCRIFHDRGSEYFSTYSEKYTASRGIDLIRRPVSEPRFGDKVESHLGRINQLIIGQLWGNTKNDKVGRSSTKEVRSAAHARHTLVSFLRTIERSIEILNDRPVGDKTASPRQLFTYSEGVYDGIARKVAITSEFLAETAIPSIRPDPKISHTHGIKFQNRRYVGPGISAPELDGMKVPVRWEPYNPCILYAHVRGSWVQLTCPGYAELESTDAIYRTAEVYLRFHTAPAARVARAAADLELGRQLRKELALPPPEPRVAQERPQKDALDELFTEARSIELNRRGGQSL